MLNPRQIAISPEDFFAQRYGRMLEWSLHLTGGDRAAAEDLLHDLFLLFTLRQPDFESIENVEGYLYTMLRNLHLSQLRRATRAGLRQLSIVEFDSAELGLRAAHPQGRLQARDELRRVCDYVCVRKEKSKAASVLILRFFHGYYPSEIVRLLKVSRKAVDVQLLTARNEAKLFLEDPGALTLLGERRAVTRGDGPPARPTDDVLADLREMIFHSRRGECLPAEQMQSLYRDGAASIACEPLAHIVSCPRCLEAVNKLIGLPSLAERYPMDTLIRDSKKKGGGGDDGGGGATGGASGGGAAAARRTLRRWRRQAGEVFEHKPRELCISVNGYAQGSRRVSSEFNDMQLVLDLAEPIRFVEVFSEQQMRLLFLNVELPPGGACVQPSKVELSDGRTLDLTLEFSSPWPTLQVVYHDPAFALPEASAAQGDSEHESAAAGLRVVGESPEVSGTRDALDALSWRAAGLRGAILSPRLWLRPGFVSAAVALALVAALLFVRMSVPAVSAAELLDRTLAAEEEVAAKGDTVVYRTMQMEEREAGGGALITHRRIETWRSAARGVTVRRLYDQGGRLVASEWRRGDGSRTVYRLPAEARAAGVEDAAAEVAWLVEPSARDFSALVGRGGEARVEEERGAYVISYRGTAAGSGVVSATLRISRAGMRATGQKLVVRHGGAAREFRFEETGFNLRRSAETPPSAFEQNEEFLKVGVTRTVIPSAAEVKPGSPAEPQRPAPASVTATSELEVEVLRLLNQVGADLGEQISVSRTPGGRLRVQGIVETQARRGELMRALAALRNNPAVEVAVSTSSEALSADGAAGATPAPVVQQVEPSDSRIPAEDEMRRYFSKEKGMSEDEAHAAILSFAVQASQRSRLALQHAWAMKRLAGRFSERELRTLDGTARAKWLSMIREHAAVVRRESARLRQELQPIFSRAGGATVDAAAPDVEVADEAGLARAVERLLSLCTDTDKGVRLAFSASPDGSAGTALKTVGFWRSLGQAEGLAARVERATQKMQKTPDTPAQGAPEEK